MTKPGIKTVTVGLTDEEYAALLRFSADKRVRPTDAARSLLRKSLGLGD